MKLPRKTARSGQLEQVLWRLLTLERLMTSSIAVLVYWIGLGIIALLGFAAIGATLGMALREPDIQGVVLAIPVLVAGFLVVCALAILWRSFCELYVVVIHIGDDLSALRRAAEAQGLLPRLEPPAPDQAHDPAENESATAQNAGLGSP